MATRKTTAKNVAKKAAKKAPAPAKKASAPAKKSPAPANKATAKPGLPGKAPAKKGAATGPGTNTTPRKTRGPKYGPKASEAVREEMDAFKHGQLRIGKSNKKVTDPKQAIAIGLAKARRAGGKVPPNPHTGR